MSRDEAHVLDILEAARRARSFVEDLTDGVFLDDLKTQSAVLHQLTVLGEATRRVSEEYRSSHPDLPWKEMAGLRSRIVHDYDEVDLDQVWTVLQKDLPDLISKLETIAKTEPE